jgi:hypothetical protein
MIFWICLGALAAEPKIIMVPAGTTVTAEIDSALLPESPHYDRCLLLALQAPLVEDALERCQARLDSAIETGGLAEGILGHVEQLELDIESARTASYDLAVALDREQVAHQRTKRQRNVLGGALAAWVGGIALTVGIAIAL